MNANLALTSRSCRLSKAPRPRHGPGAPSERAPAASVGAARQPPSRPRAPGVRIRFRVAFERAARFKLREGRKAGPLAGHPWRPPGPAGSPSRPASLAGRAALAARRLGVDRDPRHWHAQAGPGTAAAVTGLSRQPLLPPTVPDSEARSRLGAAACRPLGTTPISSSAFGSRFLLVLVLANQTKLTGLSSLRKAAVVPTEPGVP